MVLGTRIHLDGENDKGVHSVEAGSLRTSKFFFSEFPNKPIHDLDVSLETSLLWNYKTKIGGTGSFSDTEFCPLSAVII